MTWPSWSPNLVNRGFPTGSLLEGTEPAVWSALGRLPSSAFSGRKQKPIRAALREIGLSWVATNSTPFRVAVGGIYDAAAKYRKELGHHSNSSEISGQDAKRRKIDCKLRVQLYKCHLPECDEIRGPLKHGKVTASQRAVLWKQIREHGACVIRGAVPRDDISTSPPESSSRAKKVRLAETTGNGVAGVPPSYYTDLPQPEPSTWRYELEAGVWDVLLGEGAEGEAAEANFSNPPERKSILLCCGEGSENWAHQDNNADGMAPVQAVLMLSEPGKSFQGGDFYVAKQEQSQNQEGICFRRYEVSFQSPGDLIIFQAGKGSGWWHGMLPVRSGNDNSSEQGFLRETVGLLQPVT